MAPQSIPTADIIPSLADATDIAPILLRLLECPTSLLPILSSQTLLALQELPQEDKPTSYEGLLDIARFCVEEEPGWEDDQRAKLIGGHPRIGRQVGAISEASSKEQGAGAGASGAQVEEEEVLKRLDKLNFLYEREYPTLRFVTYVAGRSKTLVADELQKLLGSSITSLPPNGAVLDPDNVAASWSGFPGSKVNAIGSAAWTAELRRGEDALWDIAGNRAAKLAKEVGDKGIVTIDVSPPEVDITTSKDGDGSSLAPAAFDTPFLSQATFRALIFASPLLHTFFETDLPQSFLLQPVERHTSTRDALMSVFHDVTAGPSSSSSIGPGSMVGGTAPAPRSTGITRDRVKGLLGGLLGEVADAVGTRFQQQTISGPKPSFARSKTGGGRALTLEEGARGSTRAGGKMGLVSPAALSHRMERTSLSSSSTTGGVSIGGGIGENAGLLSSQGADDAAEALRLAQEALSQRDTNQFVIDAPGEGEGDETVETEREDEDDVDDLVPVDQSATGAAGGAGAPGRVTGKEAQLAKDLRSAEAQ